MSRFDLVPMAGGVRVHLPPGETPLGRGPLLGISDKRVSRHHAVVDVSGGEVRLKSTHVNPCFLQSSLDDDPRPLDKDRWVGLCPGDFLSLLPGRFLYQLVELGGATDVLRDIPSPLDASGPGPGTGSSRSPDRQRGPDGDQRTRGSTPELSECKAAELRPAWGAVSPARPKRLLPAWMMKVSTQTAGYAPSPPASLPAANRRKEPRMAMLTSSAVEAELSEEGVPRKKMRKSRVEEVERSDDVIMEEEEKKKRGGSWAVVIDRRSDKEAANSVAPPTQTPASTPAQMSKPRTLCPYGSSCYRKNPAHFQDWSHPGDHDFQEEEVDPAHLPVCPYGAACYRKNPLHRKQFTHGRRPARSTRTVNRTAAVEEEKEEDDDEDENDHESSFDDSDDGGGDSDYVLADEDEDDCKNVTRLQSEARDFLRKRK